MLCTASRFAVLERQHILLTCTVLSRQELKYVDGHVSHVGDDSLGSGLEPPGHVCFGSTYMTK